MNDLLQNFIEALREELKQYGGLLALLDLEQEQVIRRLPDELLQTVSAITAQGEAIGAARLEREQRQRQLAWSLELAPEVAVSAITSTIPEPYRPLVTALVEENNQLLQRVRQRARQNHLLLSRATELMTQFLNSLCGIGQPTYSPSGTVAMPAAPGRSLYEEIC